MNCTKAIIPTAGYGTRRLPITKTIEKSMLPILNRPVIDYIVEDCIKAGVKDIYFVVGTDAAQIREYYSRAQQLEEYLVAQGKTEYVASITPPQGVNFHFVEQDTSANALYGTAIPVWLCRDVLEPGEQVLVVSGDDFIYNADGSSEIARLLAEAKKVGEGSVMLGVEVPSEQVSRYGVLAFHEQAGHHRFDYVQEKPPVSEAASNLVNVSKYLFDADFFTYLEQVVRTSRTGEYYITDAINAYVEGGHAMYVLPAHGVYLDSGTVEGWLYANNYVAEHPQKS